MNNNHKSNFKVYNETWSADARYVGLEWFHGKFCRKFENTYPFFVQGELYESVYYEEVSLGLPAGYVNPVAETLFWDWEVAMVLEDGDEKTNGNMTDESIAPKAHFLNIRDACLEEYNSQNEIDESKILYVWFLLDFQSLFYYNFYCLPYMFQNNVCNTYLSYKKMLNLIMFDAFLVSQRLSFFLAFNLIMNF